MFFNVCVLLSFSSVAAHGFLAWAWLLCKRTSFGETRRLRVQICFALEGPCRAYGTYATCPCNTYRSKTEIDK